MSRVHGGSATSISSTTVTGTSDVNIKQVGGVNFSLGQQLAASSLPVVLTASQLTTLTPPAAITNYALETGGNLATIAGKDFATQTTLALIKAKTDNLDVLLSTRLKPADTLTAVTTITTVSNISQIASVTPVFGDVNNATGETGALNIVPVGRYNATQPTLTDTRYNQLQVSSRGELLIAAGVSGLTVTANAGTNLNTSALALESGGNLATLAGGVSASVYQENIKQINGVTPLMGNGTTGTGSLRVTIASDNTAFAVNATLSAETTKVIGTVNQGTSPWVVGGGLTNNNAAPGATNAGVLPAIANAAQQSWTEGRQVLLSTNLKGSVRGIIQDAAGNDRGANINSSNQMTVVDAATGATGSAVPASAHYMGMLDGSGLLKGLQRVDNLADNSSGMLGVGIYTYNGVNWDKTRTINVFKPQNAVSISTESTIWTPASGKKFRLQGYHLSASVAGNIILKDNTAGTTIAIIPSGAGGSGVMVILGNGILSASANNVLTATGPAASTLSGMVFGTEE